MATSGRQPVATELKLITTREGHKVRDNSTARRLKPDHGTVPVLADRPDHIPYTPKELKRDGRGRRYWRLYWESARQWLGISDMPMVERLCLLHDQAEEMHLTLAKEGSTVVGNHGFSIAHPLWRGYHEVLRQLERLEIELGLSPVQRSRIRIQAKDTESSLDTWRNARKNGTEAK